MLPQLRNLFILTVALVSESYLLEVEKAVLEIQHCQIVLRNANITVK